MTTIDRLRAKVLKQVFKITCIKNLYQIRHLRVLVNYLLVSLVALFIAVLRSDILLVLGPLIYGYLHLITSYKYSSTLISPVMNLSKNKSIFFMVFLELLSLKYFYSCVVNILLAFWFPTVLSGSTLSLIFLLLLYIKHDANKNIINKTIFIILGIFIMCISWAEPLNFVSMTLFAHNWIAFVAWLKFSRDKRNFMVCIFAFLIFALIHILVLAGVFDSFFMLFEESFWMISSGQEIGWLLALGPTMKLSGEEAYVCILLDFLFTTLFGLSHTGKMCIKIIHL